jgi:hypothetical protein
LISQFALPGVPGSFDRNGGPACAMPARGIDAIDTQMQASVHARTPGGNRNSFTADSRALFERRILHRSSIHWLYEFITLNRRFGSVSQHEL